MKISVIFKNYRCFSDEFPFTLKFQEGITSFIGPNNAGKSTALRALYEIRPLLQLTTPRNGVLMAMYSNAGHSAHQTKLQGIEDVEHVFFLGNERPVSIEIVIERDAEDREEGDAHLDAQQRRIRFVIDRTEKKLSSPHLCPNLQH